MTIVVVQCCCYCYCCCVGHGGDGFLKFQDHEEISSAELADAFQQMWQKKRFATMQCTVEYCLLLYRQYCTLFDYYY